MNSRENKLVNKLIATLIFYISLPLVYFNFLEYIWFGKTEATIRFIISPTMWGFLISLASAFLIEKEFRKLLLGKIGILYGSALLLYSLIGWISGNGIDWMYKEWLILIYPWFGMAMFFLLSKSYSPKFQLTAYAFFLTYIIYQTFQTSIKVMLAKGVISTNSAIGMDTRVAGGNMIIITASLIATGISLVILCRLGWFLVIPLLGLVFLQFYFAGFIGATRGAFLGVLVVFICSGFGLLFYKVCSRTMVLNPQPSMSLRWLKFILISFTIFIFIAIIAITFDFDLVQLFQGNLLYERAFTDESSGSDNARIEEASFVIGNLQDLDFLAGKGLGATFINPIRRGWNVDLEINWLHIGPLTFLLKGGLPLFLVVIFFFYIKIPYLYCKALLNPYAFDPKERTALLTVLPGVLGWSIWLLTSGGYDGLNFFGLGFGFGAYSHIRKHGLGIFFE
ncbi:MAG: hypothetical protein EWV76_15455 [Microcystis novacekii Mn_MB_F_20050700_S1]|uniref:O-antigen ligase domain-containing protein n=1 Tax=Microcystis novacekii Mn_MB_F_20050700_S1D TaxID=2486266 RepID=A0A552J6V4_9CHRO|nr:MAG: hypothetical protein EWV76_15455 [Microcystis novacekii Mn_MB_F_20050700_S1]TRU91480.1 MAG: hypothetical protein EWV54_04340 [Microcystis novacekii Mn_MB_F_20050700_S1D]